MNLILQTKDFDLTNIFFSDKKTNMIMDGVFTKIIFSSKSIIMHGLYFDFPIKNALINKLQNKNILQLNIVNNREFLKKFIDIEEKILNYYNHYYNCKKNIIYNLKNQINLGSLKYYSSPNNNIYSNHSLYIKISGIWENNYEIGITFKIIEY